NRVDELFCLDQLAAYKDKGLNLTTEFAVVEGADGWDGAIGHVTQLLRSELIGSGPDVYLCGPPPMIEAGQTWLADHKVNDKLIHVEKFLPS
ncbi:MAG: anthranilate 1,2-dioxygenase electron transfer component AntC, partial [Proteobacteria bacterium]|nr:anthranilate 1,2-dioxygenase electron transfer component AntC [Pseudomonadota bacterium]